MKRWRRLLIVIALLLLAGAVGNVAVAWGVAALAEPVQGHRRGYTHASLTVESAGYSNEYLNTLEAGWPLRSLGATSRRSVGPILGGIPGVPGIFRSRPAPPRVGGPYAAGMSPGVLRHTRLFGASAGLIPLTPIPAGFAINTLFYAAILALPLSVFPIRRRLRARRGRCPKCGYDLAGLAGAEKGAEGAAPCPECGATR